MPIVSGGGTSGALSGVTVTGTAASGQVPVASSSSAGAWAYPPGFEISYTAITSPVNVVSTTESTGTAIISPAAATFDGGAVLVEFFGNIKSPSIAGQSVVVSLFESTTQITEMVQLTTPAAANAILSMTGKYRFTPTAGSHTYAITAFTTNTTGTPAVNAGAGGTGNAPPAYVRFTKV